MTFFLKNNCSFIWKSRLISWFPCGLPGDRYIMEPYTKYNLRTGQTGFPDQGDALKVQENANTVAMPDPLPPPFLANSWTHDYGAQIWWEAGMATHPKNVPGSGLMVGHIRAWGSGFRGRDMSTQPQNVSGSGVGRIYFRGGGGSVCEQAVENETKQLSSWEAETICISLRKYLARPAISTLAGYKLTFMFWWQMFLFTSSFSVTDQPRDYHAWFHSLKHLHRPLL